MVTIHFKLTEAAPVMLEMVEPKKLAVVVQECAQQKEVELGSYIAVRNGKVITPDTLVAGNDVIDIFPAISGG